MRNNGILLSVYLHPNLPVKLAGANAIISANWLCGSDRTGSNQACSQSSRTEVIDSTESNIYIACSFRVMINEELVFISNFI